MGFVRKHTGIDLTGGGARRAAEQASRAQIAGEERGLEALRADLAPFRELGVSASEQLLPMLEGLQARPAEDIINDPFFKALAQEQDQATLARRAALGLGGSGGTQDALMRNMLLLGNQFQQQDLANQFSKFNSLFNLSTLGQNAAARTGTAALQSAQNIGGLQGVPHLARAQQQGQFTQNVFGALGASDPTNPFSALSGAGGLSAIFGGGAAAGGAAAAPSLASGMAAFSDRRLKNNIVKVGEDENGNIYEFSYNHFDGRFIGRMAQELRKIRPDAVIEHESGFLQVAPEFQARAV